jgi:hypothetical protein
VKGSLLARAATLAQPQNCLESFHYIGKQQAVVDYIRADKRQIFLDSGSFTAYTKKAEIDIRQYGRFIYKNWDIIETASNLDAIGSAEQTYANQKTLEGWLKPYGMAVQPVHHIRDDDKWLQRYLDEGYDHISLGGMVPENTPLLRDGLDHLWSKYLTNPDGTPKVKVHGFGLTTRELMFRYPWYSVDSTSWAMTAMFGSCLIDFPEPDGTIRDFKVDFSHRSQKQKDINSWHFSCLADRHKAVVLARLEELEAERIKTPDVEQRLERLTGFKQGFNPVALGRSYGWRDNFNIQYFKRAENRAVDRFVRTQQTLFT